MVGLLMNDIHNVYISENMTQGGQIKHDVDDDNDDVTRNKEMTTAC
jgi:hypothetical protein